MTPTQNELIRYPVSVNPNYCSGIVDADGKYLCYVDVEKATMEHDEDVASEIVRVLNAYYEIMQWKGGYFAEKLISHPAPVAASGEPSEAAMMAAREWYCDEPEEDPHPAIASLARIIDTAFAAERAKSAKRISDIESRESRLAELLLKAERERDEARVELANERKLADGYLTRNKIHQLRTDLDEAVGLLKTAGEIPFMDNSKHNGTPSQIAVDSITWRDTHKVLCDAFQLANRLSKPSEPGAVELPAQAPCASVDTPCAPHEPATESGDGDWKSRSDLETENARLNRVIAAREETVKLMRASWKHYEEQHATRLAERDAEIARLNAVLAGVEQIIHSSSASEVV